MKDVMFAIFIVLFGAIVVTAQDWVESSKSRIEYNCELIEMILEDFGDEAYVREDGEIQTLDDFYADTVPECTSDIDSSIPPGSTLFKVTVRSSVNLRDCGNTTCDLVGKTEAGDILDVIAEDGDWYEIRYERGTAFVAGWLTTRLPDALVETDASVLVPGTACIIAPNLKRGDMDINIIITGGRKDDVKVDLYRPDDENPMRVDGQLDKTFIDTGDTYIFQYYYWNTWFPTGIYTVQVEIDDQIQKVAWNVTERADYNVFVLCE